MIAKNEKPYLDLKSRTGRSYLRFRLSGRFLLRSLAVMIAAVLVAAGTVAWCHRENEELRGKVGREFVLREGPWGRLYARPVLLTPPKRVFDPDFTLGDGKWYFEKAPLAEIEALLKSCGLSDQQSATLVSLLQPVEATPGLLAVAPPHDLVLGLTPDVRSRFYRRLALLDANFAQCQPFRMAERHLQSWMESDGFDNSLERDVRGLLWRSGDTLMFSDYNLLASRMSAPSERIAFQQLLAQKVSLFLRIEITPDANVVQLNDYWSADGRGEEVLPILSSTAASGGGTIGIMNLMPPFVREHLNRFPEEPTAGAPLPACHWSSLNVFTRGEPDHSFHETAAVEREIRTRYRRVEDHPRFGDLVLLNEPNGSSIHSAVYIADDIIFTKNGPSPATPWVFSTIEEMKAAYPSSVPLTTAFLRHR
jgi:hypothetical protein